MKKFIFAFIATIMLTGGAFGQTQPTKEQVEARLTEGMAEFIKNLETFYVKGQSYEQFKISLYRNKHAPSTIPKEGDDLLKKAYSYLTKGGVTKEQIKKDGMKEFGMAVYFVYNFELSNRGKDGSAVLFGVENANSLNYMNHIQKIQNGPCRWWQIGCWFQEIFGDLSPIIIEIIKIILHL